MRKILVLLITFIFAFAFVSCAEETTTAAGETTTEEATPVKFGVIGPLTGDYQMYGVAVENGARLAAAEINANGGVLGVTLEIIAYDSKGDSTDGVNAYNRLVEQDEVDALIGGTFSGVTLALKSLAISDNLPVLTPTATNPAVTTDAPNIFRACYTDSYQGSVAAVFVAEDLEATKVAVMYNRDDAYSEGLAEAFIAELDSRSIANTSFEFGASDDDYSAILTNIKNGGYDAVFLPAYVAEVGAVLTQASNLGLDMPFIGGDGWDGIEGDYATVAEGNYFVNHYAKTDPSTIVQNFVANYTSEYGEAPNALAALAYDAVYAMAAAFEAAGSTDADAVINALAALSFTTGVTGSISFDENGDPIKSITVIKVVEGVHVVETKVEAS